MILIAFIFSELGSIPSKVIICLSNFKVVALNMHFLLFIFNLFFCIDCSTCFAVISKSGMHFCLIIYVKLAVLCFCYVFNYTVFFILKSHKYCMNTVQGRLLKPKQPV